MSKPQQQQQRVVTAVTISLSAQMKMALHATKHGMSNCQVHGIVLGSTTTTTSSAPSSTSTASSVSVVVTDVVPVCHEVPTKPIVDSALRLVDAHLRLSSTTAATATTRIIGWYTANDNTNAEKEEEPKKVNTMNTYTHGQKRRKLRVYQRRPAPVGHMPLFASGTYYMHVCDGCQQARRATSYEQHAMMASTT